MRQKIVDHENHFDTDRAPGGKAKRHSLRVVHFQMRSTDKVASSKDVRELVWKTIQRDLWSVNMRILCEESGRVTPEQEVVVRAKLDEFANLYMHFMRTTADDSILFHHSSL